MHDTNLRLLHLKSDAFDLIHLHEHGDLERLRRFFLNQIPDLSQYHGLVIVNPEATTESLRDFVWTKLQEVNDQIMRLTSPEDALDLSGDEDAVTQPEEAPSDPEPSQPSEEPTVPADELPTFETPDPLAEIPLENQERTI